LAGFKTFVSGEILTAADLNSFVANQVVGVYDDAAARDTALPSPLEGQLVYLKDDDVVLKYDGSDFLPVGGLVSVKYAERSTAYAASVSAGSNVAVDDLSITHEVQNVGNRLIITAFFGQSGSGRSSTAPGIAIAEDGTLINVNASPGSRRAVTGFTRGGASSVDSTYNQSITILRTPTAGSKTYTVRAINVDTSTQTLYVNRSESDGNDGFQARSVSGLTIQEVAV